MTALHPYRVEIRPERGAFGVVYWVEACTASEARAMALADSGPGEVVSARRTQLTDCQYYKRFKRFRHDR